MTERVIVDIRNHVASVTLNRAHKHNAVDIAMFEAIIEAGESLAQDRSVRAVVLSGDGESFCAGIGCSKTTRSVHSMLTMTSFASVATTRTAGSVRYMRRL